jgi:hypothetical protein
MAMNRWSIRSLRRFKDREILINAYVGIGGVFSLIYAICAVLRTKLYLHIFSVEVIQHSGLIIHVVIEMILHAILRALFWLPQIIYAALINHQSLWDWMTAAQILKDLS